MLLYRAVSRSHAPLTHIPITSIPPYLHTEITGENDQFARDKQEHVRLSQLMRLQIHHEAEAGQELAEFRVEVQRTHTLQQALCAVHAELGLAQAGREMGWDGWHVDGDGDGMGM